MLQGGQGMAFDAAADPRRGAEDAGAGDGHRDGHRLGSRHGQRSTPATKAKMQGYEGEPCGECGNYTLVRNGTCMKCNTCGGDERVQLRGTGMEVVACIETEGVASDPLVIDLTLRGSGDACTGAGWFDLPPRFAGSLVRAGGLWRAEMHDGSRFAFRVTGFDMMTGVARFETEGPLPFAAARPRRA